MLNGRRLANDSNSIENYLYTIHILNRECKKSLKRGERERVKCLDDEFITLLFINRQTNNIFHTALLHTVP